MVSRIFLPINSTHNQPVFFAAGFRKILVIEMKLLALRERMNKKKENGGPYKTTRDDMGLGATVVNRKMVIRKRHYIWQSLPLPNVSMKHQ